MPCFCKRTQKLLFFISMLSHGNKEGRFFLVVLKKLFENKGKFRTSLLSSVVSNTQTSYKEKKLSKNHVKCGRDGSSDFFLKAHYIFSLESVTKNIME